MPDRPLLGSGSVPGSWRPGSCQESSPRLPASDWAAAPDHVLLAVCSEGWKRVHTDIVAPGCGLQL